MSPGPRRVPGVRGTHLPTLVSGCKVGGCGPSTVSCRPPAHWVRLCLPASQAQNLKCCTHIGAGAHPHLTPDRSG